VTTTQIQKRQPAAPTGLAASPNVGGGTFGAGSQFWKITAVTALGESVGSGEATATIAASGTASLTWTAYPTAQWINVYRGTVTGTENKLIAQLPGTATAFLDTGTAGTSVSPPSATAWASATKSSGVPTKANEPANTADGYTQEIYAGLVGWCQAVLMGRGTDQTRNRKYLLAAGWDVQEV
jgi:hypothetical protein